MRPRQILHGLRNLKKWLPIIWYDRNWDYEFLLEILGTKLHNMAEFFDSDRAMSMDHRKVARQLRICGDLCSRIQNDDYSKVPLKAHTKKWGELKMETEPAESNLRRVIFSRPRAVTEKQKLQEGIEARRIFREAEQQRQADINYLCNMISKHLLCWWD